MWKDTRQAHSGQDQAKTTATETEQVKETVDPQVVKGREAAEVRAYEQARESSVSAEAVPVTAPVSADTVEPKPEKPFYVVGIGASAGGFEALEQFFDAMPSDTGMAFVVVQHLSPDHKSLMVELLSKHTKMEVLQATDGMALAPNCVYLIPPKKTMTVADASLLLEDKAGKHVISFPIDIFLNSLAEDFGTKAIAIILSGTGSDGTRGIRSVKEQGGIIMVQAVESAKFDGMPRNAIATGLADYVLKPERMPEELSKYIRHPYVAYPGTGENKLLSDEHRLSKIFSILKAKTGVDFSNYKQNTVSRRIERRMSVNQIEKVRDYVDFLYQNEKEVEILKKEMLIGVTRFFRDPEAYAVLREKVIPEIFASKGDGAPIRVWVAGCATGEEAYSLAILFREYMDEHGLTNEVKVFATDIDNQALDFASVGQYPENIAADLTSERFQKYFVRKGDRYQVSKLIREMVIFALHNLIKDPPFNKIDLLTCRNLLIYFQPVLQKKVLLNFNFALGDGAFLFLGSSETIGEFTNLFTPYDPKWKFYRCRGRLTPLYLDSVNLTTPRRQTQPRRVYEEFIPQKFSQDKKIRDIYETIFRRYVPPCAVINARRELLHVLGDVTNFLALQPGTVSLSISDLIRRDLAVALETGMNKVFREGKEIVYTNVQVSTQSGKLLTIDIQFLPYGGSKDPHDMLLLVIFQEAAKQRELPQGETLNRSGTDEQRYDDLEHELQYTKENLQATIEELETTNEELQATNEELLSANEELQSTNEELQSVNEELITVNSEYQSKIQELTELNNDMNNLLASTDIGTIFLDRELNVRKFTPAITEEISLMDSDIGRPISHIALNVHYDSLLEDCKKVLSTLIPLEREVRNDKDGWFLLRILPYKTEENIIRGVVITFINISSLKEATAELRKLSHAMELSPSIVVITGVNGKIEYVNKAFTDVTGYTEQEVKSRNVRFLKSGRTAEAEYRKLWKTISAGENWSGVFYNLRKSGEGYYEYATIIPVKDVKGRIVNYIKVAEDITERRAAQREVEESRRKVFSILESTTDGYLEIDPDWRLAYINKKAVTFLKKSRKELMNKRFWDVFPDAMGTPLFKAFNEAKEHGENILLEEYNGMLDSWFEFHVFPETVRAEEGTDPAGQEENETATKLYVYFRDVTEQVQVREQLRREHELALGIAKTSPVAIVVLGLDGRITFANGQAEQLFGISEEAMTSRTFDDTAWEIMAEDGSEFPVEELPFARVLREKASVFGVKHAIRRAGEETPRLLCVNAAPLFDVNGEILSVVCAIEDITGA